MMMPIDIELEGRGASDGDQGPVSPTQPYFRVRKKEKTFRAAMTRDGWLLLAMLCLLPAVLLWQGALILLAGHAPGWGFVGVAAVALAGIVFHFSGRMRQSIRVTPERFVFEQGSRRVVMAWEDMKNFVPPGEWKRHFRTVRLGDADREVRFDSCTFPEFDLLVSLITVARRSRGALRDDTYKI